MSIQTLNSFLHNINKKYFIKEEQIKNILTAVKLAKKQEDYFFIRYDNSKI